MIANEISEFYETFQRDIGKVQEAVPETLKGFGGLFASTMKKGQLDVREKELIAMSVSMALRCEPCINLHVKKCLEAGASRAQILEAASVVVMMQGGPGYTYLPKIMHALEACDTTLGKCSV